MLLQQEGNIEFWAMDIFCPFFDKKMGETLRSSNNREFTVVGLGIYDMVMSERWILQRMEGILLGYLKMT